MVIRAALVALCLAATHLYIAAAVRREPATLRQPLAGIPMRIGDWSGQDAPIEQKFLDSLKLDDHVNRTYQQPDGLPVTLYVGYYGGMRTGNQQGPHPPMLCLPGQGWQPIETSLLPIPGGDAAEASAGDALTVSRYVIDNGTGYRFLLLFWYQIHDRAVPTEMASKLRLFADGFAARGTDGALVRVALPLMDRRPVTAAGAEREGVAFIRSIRPLLAQHFPGDGE
jgi:EpsI family protein